MVKDGRNKKPWLAKLEFWGQKIPDEHVPRNVPSEQ
jgi:hypothetical protein